MTGPSVTSSPVEQPVVVEGTAGRYRYTATIKVSRDEVCLRVVADPPVHVDIDLRPARAPRRTTALPAAGPDDGVCLAQQLNADPQAVGFQPIFVPHITQGDNVDDALVAGLVAPEITGVELRLATGEAVPVTVEDAGLFVASPSELVEAIEITRGDTPTRLTCPIMQDGAGWRLATCQR